MTTQWDLPPAQDDDWELNSLLMKSGASTAPRTKWDIECMIRVVARIMHEHGLLDQDASWAAIRHSRSERAGGLTVQFDQHPDEIDVRYAEKDMIYFRFRKERPEQSQEALVAMTEACRRRAVLNARRRDIDEGRLSDEGGLMCDAVLPAYLRSKGRDPSFLEPSLRSGNVVEAPGPMIDDQGMQIDTGDMNFKLTVSNDRNALRVVYVQIGPEITYKSTGPTLVIRRQQWPDTVLSAMVGRPVCDFVNHPALDIAGLNIVNARSGGDATTLVLTRVSTTLCEPDR